MLPFISILLSACTGVDKKPQIKPVIISQKEKQTGGKVYKLFEKHYGFYDKPELESYIKSMVLNVLSHTPARNAAITFRILDTSLVNARATPGGYIYVTKGLLALANNESQVASIIAHEIAHVVAGHTKKKYEQKEKILKISRNINRNINTNMAKQVTTLFSKVIIKGNQRRNELEADRLALHYISKTRYSTSSMLNMLELLKKFSAYSNSFQTESGYTENSILSTHPSIDRRITELKKNYKKNNYSRTITSNSVIDKRYLDKINGLVIGKINNRKVVLGLKHFPDYNRYIREVKNYSNGDRILAEYIRVLNNIPANRQNNSPLLIKWLERK